MKKINYLKDCLIKLDLLKNIELSITADFLMKQVRFELKTKLEKESLKKLRLEYDKFYAVTDEKIDNKEFNEKVDKKNQLETKGIEVGHIFYFGDKYSKPMNAAVDKDGKKIFVKMGSYGIGVSRLVGALIEANFDEKNEVMKWPISVSPFECAIICFASKNDNTSIEMGIKVKNFLEENNIETVLQRK